MSVSQDFPSAPVVTSIAPAVAAARRSAAVGPMRSTIRPANAELNTPTKKKALTVIPISAAPMPRSSWICTARALTSVGERLAAVVTTREAVTSAANPVVCPGRPSRLARPGDPPIPTTESRPGPKPSRTQRSRGRV